MLAKEVDALLSKIMKEAREYGINEDPANEAIEKLNGYEENDKIFQR